jgi:hypothetical protein
MRAHDQVIESTGTSATSCAGQSRGTVSKITEDRELRNLASMVCIAARVHKNWMAGCSNNMDELLLEKPGHLRSCSKLLACCKRRRV